MGEDDPGESPAVSVCFPKLFGYRLVECLGAGGSGEVFRAYRDGSDQPVAVKIYRNRLGSGPSASRAWRELDLLAQLRLPALPRLLDHGTLDGRLFLTTELIDGLPLHHYATEHGLARRERVRLLARVADAVHELHSRGVIHRDLKPSNILVTHSGDPVVVDLGLATIAADNVMETLTADGAPVGTPAYMAPEQARGDRDRISTRTDIYSLGATALDLLTGCTPHPTDSAGSLFEAVRQVGHDPPRDPGTIDPTLPVPLAAVLGKAIAAKPEDRYPSAVEFGDELRRWLAGEPVNATGPTPWQRMARWGGGHPIVASTVLGGAILLASVLASGATTWWMNRRPDHVALSRDRTTVQLVTATGRPLRSWISRNTQEPAFGVKLDRPAPLGGGTVVATLIKEATEGSGPSDQVCVWDFYHPERLLWRTPGGTPDGMPMPVRPTPSKYEGRPERFEAHYAARLDIFDSPGDELVVVLCDGAWSPRVIRVFDLAGQVLYEAWHDGEIREMYWIPSARALIVAGRHRSHDWEERLPVNDPQRPSLVDIGPLVVFAIKPRLGETTSRWIDPEATPRHPDLLWYKALRPAEASRRYHLALDAPFDLANSDNRFLLGVQARLHGDELSSGGFHMEVDLDGHIVPGTLSGVDGYSTAAGEPDLSEVRLEDLPPVVSPAED